MTKRFAFVLLSLVIFTERMTASLGCESNSDCDEANGLYCCRQIKKCRSSCDREVCSSNEDCGSADLCCSSNKDCVTNKTSCSSSKAILSTKYVFIIVIAALGVVCVIVAMVCSAACARKTIESSGGNVSGYINEAMEEEVAGGEAAGKEAAGEEAAGKEAAAELTVEDV